MKVVAVQLQTHLDEAGLMTAFQSAYRKHHSTECALLNIHNDILLNMAKGSITALTLLDLSAAFDTIDHTILLDRLNVYCGISLLALGWLKSYLSGRTHSVKVGSTLSHPAVLQYGPILFSLYTYPISSIIHSHSSINCHFYADDTQLYITLSPANFSHSMQKLKNCLNGIQNFMFTNKLKLNPDKTEFILIGSPKILNNFSLSSLSIFWEIRSPQHKASGTSEWCSTPISISQTGYMSQVIKSTRIHARDLYRIRPLLDLKTSVLLANALVSSRLDYCNSLFLSLTDFELSRLQLVQNSLCRVVTHSSKFSHITPELKKIHWLPVRYRVQFKIGIITYKIFNQGQPVYLRELIHPYTSSRNTRRSTPKLKFVQTPTFYRRVHKSIKHFSISFSHYAPVHWNSFPFHVRNSPSVASFRKDLKTHLFSSSLICLISALSSPLWGRCCACKAVD